MKRLPVVCKLAILAVALFAIGFWAKRMLAIDSCLDRGGRWSYESAMCEYE